jgi:hypothetical protein
MEITQNVILDLLPLYIADEVSDDSRALVEEYLKTDSELNEIAEQSRNLDLSGEVPVPLTKEDQMEAYERAKRELYWKVLIAGVVLAGILMAFLAFVGVVAMFLLQA